VHAGMKLKQTEFAAAMPRTRCANLALQGGGAHGAFTWGVLDRLLEEPSFAIDGISATSSGTINAVVLAHGLTVGGREGAKKALFDFWHRMAETATTSILQPSWYDRLTHNHSLEHSPGGRPLVRAIRPRDTKAQPCQIRRSA
jgi:NTE family protein